ncbi:MAG: ribosome biosynthesis protein rrb1 [Peltula sp. TS41687]|nr:MAG: ribosome biosynthesis protein rrb1 [Peltula sp. TS41687]
MGKRAGEPIGDEEDALKSGRRPQKEGDEGDAVEYADEYDDEYETEDELIEAEAEGDDEREQEDAMQVDKQTFIPGRHKLAPGETLSPDPSSYEMLHTLTTTWPCLSFDIIRDNLGDGRKSYPATVYAVGGTQAQSGRERENELMVMKLSGLSRMHRGDDEDSSDVEDDDDEEDAEPILETKSLPLSSTTNRIRAHQVPPLDSSAPPTTLVASMTEMGHVLIHDVTPHLTSFDTPGTTISAQQNKPISTLRMHKNTEGYAVDWSPLAPQGKLLTGDNDGKIFATTRTEGGGWVTDTRPFSGHEGSVEEIQWSPTERNVFGSASSDGTVKIWDLRSKSRRAAISVSVSATDVNVMSWSHQTAHLLATGAEDGAWAVWDLRQWKPAAAGGGSSSSSNSADPSKSAVARFGFHKEQITSIEWHPHDDSIVAVAAGDNTLSLWDLAVELDDDESRNTEDVPPQLLFLHYAEMVKECHWHPQIPGCVMVTGGAGFG